MNTLRTDEHVKLNGEEKDDINNPPESNHIYNIWSLGALKILIRCRIHGCVPDKTCTYGEHRYVGLQVKPESRVSPLPNPVIPFEDGYEHPLAYGPVGLEGLSSSERAKWWMYSYIRPDAHLLLARIDVKRSTLLTLQSFQLKDLISSADFLKPFSNVLLHILCAIRR
jgi:hypothetical protein